MEKEDLQRIVEWRRWLHMHPETAGQEKETAKFLARELSRWVFRLRKTFMVYGFNGRTGREKAGQGVALRADMDALPVRNIPDWHINL
jgi:metal-dependent amidase/aminoacylase/carboxypeptidase family protein